MVEEQITLRGRGELEVVLELHEECGSRYWVLEVTRHGQAVTRFDSSADVLEMLSLMKRATSALMEGT